MLFSMDQPDVEMKTERDPAGNEAVKSSESKQKKQKQIQDQIAARFPAFYSQIVQGCGRQDCDNVDCASCPTAPKRTKKEAATRALALAAQKDSHLCREKTSTEKSVVSPPAQASQQAEKIQPLSLEELKDLIAESKDDGFRAVVRRLGSFFTDQEAISNSFLRKRGGDTILVTEEDPSFDHEDFANLMDILLENETFSNALHGAIDRLCMSLKVSPSAAREMPLSLLRSYLILLELRSFLDPAHHDTFKLLVQVRLGCINNVLFYSRLLCTLTTLCF